MTQKQREKLDELLQQGWERILPFGEVIRRVVGGPVKVQHPDGQIALVHPDGSVTEHKEELS